MNRRKRREIELICKTILMIIFIVCGADALFAEQWGRVIVAIIGIILTILGI